MSERTLKLIISTSKQGHSQSLTSELNWLTKDKVMEKLWQATELSPDGLNINTKQEGLTHEQTNQDELEVLEQVSTQEAITVVGFEAQAKALLEQGKRTYEISRPIGVSERAVLTCIRDSPCYPYIPTFLYCCKNNTHELHRVNLLTGEESLHKVNAFDFKSDCRWSELPGGSLLITGGGNSREVVKIDTLREFAVSSLPPMHSARHHHASVYHSQYLYVLGGYRDSYLRECERYVCPESRWIVLPALPVAVGGMSAVELDNSLYALGGCNEEYLDTVQKLSLNSLTWDLMQLKLPQAKMYFPCFKTDTEVYLVIAETLYSFTPLEVKPIKTLPQRLWCYSSYYSRGTLYFECSRGVESYYIGELTSL
jgi:hypothetical protein